MPQAILTSLDQLPAGSEVLVEKVSAIRAPGWRRRTRAGRGSGGFDGFSGAERLAALGFVPGARLTVESNFGRGPLIVSIRGARVAVGRGQAHRILVRPATPGASAGQDGPLAGG